MSLPDPHKSTLIFYVNGQKVADKDIDPEWTLIYYLRKKLKLTGTKLGCSEGGCGACTVMISKFDKDINRPIHMAVNSCLTPLASVHGLAVTTVEGIGSVTKGKLHPVQEKIAAAHGSQCGFCTPGIVMSMYTLLRSHSGKPSWEQMMETFQGNLCRCTGYRPILDGYAQFTEKSALENVSINMRNDNGSAFDNDLIQNGACALGKDCCRNGKSKPNNQSLERKETSQGNDDVGPLTDGPCQEIIFPPELAVSRVYDDEELIFNGSRVTWYRPTQLTELLKLKSLFPTAKIVNGNTEIGVEVKFKNCLYPIQIAPSQIKELNELSVVNLQNGIVSRCLKVGASVTISRIEDAMKELVKSEPETSTRTFREILKMLKFFAGKQIRNVGTISGNIMTGSPISDLNPILMAFSATVELMSKDAGRRFVSIDQNFWTGYRRNIVRPEEILVAVYIPFSKTDQYFKCYKQSRRREDDIAIVNAAYNITITDGQIKDLKMSYGGMAPTSKLAIHTSTRLVGLPLDYKTLELGYECLCEEFPLAPDAPGGMVTYRRALLLSLFHKFFLELRELLRYSDETTECLNGMVPSIDEIPLKSSQYFSIVPDSQQKTDMVGRPVVHQSAFKQATGEAVYCDDLPEFENELRAAYVTSTRAHARIVKIDSTKAEEMEGVVAFVSAKDIPSERNNCGAIVRDEEVFASEKVVCQGQIIGCIVAESLAVAQRAAKLVKIQYEDLEPTIITIEDAIEHNSYHPDSSAVELRGDVETAFQEIVKNGGRIVEGEVHIGGQEHFYLETQNAVLVPGMEDDELTIYAASQHPSEVQRQAALVLNLPFNRVTCKVKRIGGGFGGKEVRSCMLALPAAVAAHKLKRPVRMSMDRDEDMVISGQRHPFLGVYKAACMPDGRITACHFRLYSNAGYSLDLSGAVMERAMLHITNCCNFPNVLCEGYVCRTNLPSNTAFRGFGAPQAMFICETMLQHVSHEIGINVNKLHEINFYKNDDITYFGQKLPSCNVRQCWDQCLTESEVAKRRIFIDQFNREHKNVKRGMSVVPTMFGIAFSTPFLNQAGALVLVYRDGSVLLSHGGTEMGQGLHTKMIQVVSRAFGISAELIHISETSTDKVPNTSATAGSASSDLNGMAILDACDTIMRRLKPVISENPKGTWQEWINDAYFRRISLAATGFYKIPDMGRDPKTGLGNVFNYFTYGAACSEVQIDCLTGDHKVLRTDIVMDLGASLNPAIDIGQIEGAFMQGLGLFTIEQLLVSPAGALLTRGPGAYKIPSFGDVPAEFNVSLLTNSSNPRAIYSSKSVGEPPLFLASSIFFALRDAIAAFRRQNGDDSWFRMDSPATSARIRILCEDDIVRRVSDLQISDYTPWGVEP
uniref:xanthine dehydrogenase n=2 Tax=Lygus hesperus TaxID=30085 RepID=A0A146LZ03_LYGHE